MCILTLGEVSGFSESYLATDSVFQEQVACGTQFRKWLEKTMKSPLSSPSLSINRIGCRENLNILCVYSGLNPGCSGESPGKMKKFFCVVKNTYQKVYRQPFLSVQFSSVKYILHCFETDLQNFFYLAELKLYPLKNNSLFLLFPAPGIQEDIETRQIPEPRSQRF